MSKPTEPCKTKKWKTGLRCSFIAFLLEQNCNQSVEKEKLDIQQMRGALYRAEVWPPFMAGGAFFQDQMDGSDVPAKIYNGETTCIRWPDSTHEYHIKLIKVNALNTDTSDFCLELHLNLWFPEYFPYYADSQFNHPCIQLNNHRYYHETGQNKCKDDL